QERHDGERHEDRRRRGVGGGPAAARQRRRRGRERPSDARREPREVAVVEQEERQGERQVVERLVVRGEEDHDLHRRDGDRGDDARPPRSPEEPDGAELDRERRARGGLLRGTRELMRPPADPGRERRRLPVAHHRREAPPGGIPEEELREARFELEAEEEPEEEKDAERVRRGGAAGPEPRRGDEEREEGGLEEEVVPLEGEEVLADGDEGQVERPERDEAPAR